MSSVPPTDDLDLGFVDRLVPAENAEDLYEHAPCGYLSTLPDGTIIKVNETLLAWMGYSRQELVGRVRFADLLSAGGRIYHETHYAPLLSMQGQVREIALDMVRRDGTRVPVLVNSILVQTEDGKPEVIRTSVFNATSRREYERELLRAREHAESSEARVRELAQTLQTSLMPPSLPDIAGLDLGAAYRPAGRGDEVGGDFYDVFQTGSDDWAVVIGDVCGKGAQAAVVTALVRYTARAAAIRSKRPSAVLNMVNDGLLQHGGERFCTALYLRVRTAGGKAPRITFASAGHPMPMQISGDSVSPVGEPGMLLGVVERPILSDSSLQLDPGEALFCYTDGLTEARRGEDLFGDERLVDLLRAKGGRGADEVAHTTVDEAVRFQDGVARDDIAAVVVAAPRI
ncbi:MAG TPA: SpoIIE family protein phosphatase [Actinomycetota bacterium]|nr:SpoIIE family protein phosphatase [Actinomycetota bacterium]